MLGVTVNALAIVVGGLLGLFIKKGVPERFSDAIMKGLGLCVLYIAIKGALEGTNVLVLIISVAIGAVIGTLCKLDEGIHALGNKLEQHFRSGDGKSTFAEGFVTASLLFCVGAMTVVGSLDAGLTGDNSTLYTKALLDGIMSIVFASTLGVGVLFSAVFVFIFQGAIALLAGVIQPFLTDYSIAEMTCVGSVLMIAVATNMMGITKIKVMNLVPAIFIPIILCMFM